MQNFEILDYLINHYPDPDKDVPGFQYNEELEEYVISYHERGEKVEHCVRCIGQFTYETVLDLDSSGNFEDKLECLRTALHHVLDVSRLDSPITAVRTAYTDEVLHVRTELFGSNGMFELVIDLLTSLGLTEHGSSTMWPVLTEQGAYVLKLLNRWACDNDDV